MKNKKISVVIPVYNEETNIFELYGRLKKVLDSDFRTFNYEIIYVDDGSCDSTFSLLMKLREQDEDVKIVQLSRNFGHHIALSAGLDYSEGDFVVTMDGDLQDQPEEMIKLYNKTQEGYDVVFGDRQNKKFPFFKRFCSKVFACFLRLLVSEKIVINSHVYRIMTKQVVDNLKLCRESNRYVIGLIGWVGFKHSSVPVEHGARFQGETKYKFSQLVTLALDALFAFSDSLLKLIARLGLIFVCLSFALLLYVLAKRFMYGVSVKGWASLVSLILFVSGTQIFILGIIAEYLGRMYIETKRRPLYIVRNFVSDKN